MRSQILHLSVTDLKPAPSKLHATLTLSQNDKKRFSATGVSNRSHNDCHTPLCEVARRPLFFYDPPTRRDGGSAEREAVSE